MLRSYNNANAEGGVACSNANNDASDTWANNGSRLANKKLSPKIFMSVIAYREWACTNERLNLAKPIFWRQKIED